MRIERRRDPGAAEAGPLRAAADAYFWKPATAWFRCLELEAYARIGVCLAPPVLDLGSGDGRVAWMLARMGLLAGRPVGLDRSSAQLGLAARLGFHPRLVLGDGTRLPFRDGTFQSVLCNGMLCSMPEDPAAGLEEIRRVLRPGGTALLSVATDRFNDVLLWPRALGGVSRRLRALYESGMDARMSHHRTLSPTAWSDAASAAGLEVVATRPFFGHRAACRWNIMGMHVFRILGALRLADGPAARATLGALVDRGLRAAFRRAKLREEEVAETAAGYVLLEVRRA